MKLKLESRKMSKTAKPVRSATDPVEAKRRDLIFPMQTELQAAFLLMAQDLAEETCRGQ